MKKLIVTFVLVAACFAQQPAKTKPSPATTAPATTVLRGGKLLTITHGVIENGVLVMQNGRITAVGGAFTEIPQSAKSIAVTGLTVFPRPIHPQTRFGPIQILP